MKRDDIDEFSLGLVTLAPNERVCLAIRPPRLPFKFLRFWFRQCSRRPFDVFVTSLRSGDYENMAVEAPIDAIWGGWGALSLSTFTSDGSLDLHNRGAEIILELTVAGRVPT